MQLVLEYEKGGWVPGKGTVNAKARGKREHDRGHRRSLWLKAVGQVEGWRQMRLPSWAGSDSAFRATGSLMTSSKVMHVLEHSLWMTALELMSFIP